MHRRKKVKVTTTARKNHQLTPKKTLLKTKSLNETITIQNS